MGHHRHEAMLAFDEAVGPSVIPLIATVGDSAQAMTGSGLAYHGHRDTIERLCDTFRWVFPLPFTPSKGFTRHL